MESFSLISTGINILKSILDDTSKRLSNIESMLDDVSNKADIQLKKLENLEQKIDDTVARKLKASFCALLDSVGATSEQEASNIRHFAYEGFTNLICLNPNNTTFFDGKTRKNSLLISLSYFGRHIYFGLQGRYIDSLLQIYECTLKFPDEGSFIFDKRFFSKDYNSELRKLDQEIFQHSKPIQNEDLGVLLDERVLLVLGKVKFDDFDMDEDGIMLTFEREDIIDSLKNECINLINDLKLRR